MWLHASIGDVEREQGRLDDALTSFQNAHRTEDGQQNPFVLISLGATLADLGRHSEAIDPLLRAYMLEGKQLFDDFGGSYLNVLAKEGLLDTP